MNIENFVESKIRSLDGVDNKEYLDLYTSISNERLKNLFSKLHSQFNALFNSMNVRLPTGENGNHYWAEESRKLLDAIEITEDLKRVLKDSEYAFKIDDYYKSIIDKCKTFLNRSGGSAIPSLMKKIDLYYTEPIFSTNDDIVVTHINAKERYARTLIGEGSYARVYKYHDEFYNKNYAIKQLKTGLTEKEHERYIREYNLMKEFNSPYILEVYRMNEDANEYYMEHMDATLEKYISANNNKLKMSIRRRIVLQILEAFSQIHSKDILHRDISPTNVLVKQYEDTVVIKVSDFGLAKTTESTLTTAGTEFKGCFNDPALMTDGFASYSICHETYALVRIIFFVITGKTKVSENKNKALDELIARGLNVENSRRYQSVNELRQAFQNISFNEDIAR